MKHFRGLVLSLLVIVTVTAFSLVSPAKIGGVQLGRANLWQNFMEYDDEALSDVFEADFADLYSKIASDGQESADTSAVTTFFWDADSLSTGGVYRIAFLGDSFIEGDILTGDLREILQTEFGGGGVGFVPCELPFAIYRRTAKATGSGWGKYGIMKYKSVPENLQDSFLVSGYMDSGSAGAEMIWRRGEGYARVDSSDVCRIFFRSPRGCSLEVSLGDGRSRTFDVGGASGLRQIVAGTSSGTVSMKILSGSAVCYGASFETSSGVHVDNFSVRSNNGYAIFRSNVSLNRQFSGMVGYDAVVLQYGLNIMRPDKSNYAGYQKQLEDMIRYAEASFPGSRIVVMGVSDRGLVRDGDTTFTSINSAPALSRHQKAAAENRGALFWDTCSVMERLGGLGTFVGNGWIASDQVHFKFSGGKVLAAEMAGFWEELIAGKIRESRRQILLERVDADSSLVGTAERCSE